MYGSLLCKLTKFISLLPGGTQTVDDVPSVGMQLEDLDLTYLFTPREGIKEKNRKEGEEEERCLWGFRDAKYRQSLFPSVISQGDKADKADVQ